MSSQDSVQVQIAHLRSGSQLSHSIVDADDVLLLVAGTEITEPIKKCLLDRGISSVYLHPEDAASMFARPGKRTASLLRPAPEEFPISADEAIVVASSTTIAELNAQIANLSSRVSLSVQNLGPPLKNRQRRATDEPYDPQQRERLVKQFATTKKLMDTMIRHAMAGLSQDTRAVQAVANGASAELVQDPDQTIATSAEIPRNPAITERSVRMSVLAMAIAMEMGWDEQQVREVGECGLIHDWGLHRLKEEIRSQRTALTESDRQEMNQHPLYTFEMLEKMQKLSDAIRISAAQVHEKLDGSGYPRGLKSNKFIPMPKFCTSPTPMFRSPKKPGADRRTFRTM